ncbi:MAG: lysophospholipid acyltransferase family protein [Pseudomonadota bacterium]
MLKQNEAEDYGVSILHRYLVAAWLWSVFAVLTLVFFTAIFLNHVWNILWRAKNSENATHNLAGIWARSIFSSVPGWRLAITGASNIPSKNDKPVVVVCNHESITDIWAIYFLRYQFRWLSKEAVFKVPLVGPAMRWAGYIAIKRGDSRSHGQALEQCAQVIRNGISVLFFPEGTRSVTNELREFKVGAFKLALEENVQILPLAITGTRSLLKKGTMLPGNAAVKISVMPPYSLDKNRSIEENAAEARQLIVNEIARLREENHSPRITQPHMNSTKSGSAKSPSAFVHP